MRNIDSLGKKEPRKLREKQSGLFYPKPPEGDDQRRELDLNSWVAEDQHLLRSSLTGWGIDLNTRQWQTTSRSSASTNPTA